MAKKVDVPQQEPKFAGDMTNVPTIYIDGMQGAVNTAGVVKFNMYQLLQIFSEDGGVELNRVMVGRLAMSEATFLGVFHWMKDIADDITSRNEQQPDADAQ